MKLSYNWLKELVPIKLSPQKLAELLTFHVAEVESIEAVNFSTSSKNKDRVLHMDVLPNRAHDLNSHIGVAKEIAALTDQRPTTYDQRLKVTEGKKKTSEVLSVRIEDADGCPRYIGRYIEGVKITPSPKWLKERLEVLGMRSINNVVDAANYAMLEYGQPLHVFDSDAIANMEFQIPNSKSPNKRGENIKSTRKEIIVRMAKKGEKFTTLDDQTFVLDGSELLIADAEKALALAGIKGGKKAGVGAKTKNLILEAANFEPALIRRTSKKLGLATDASKLFSGGLHPVLAQRAMERLAALIQELAGGVVYGGAVDAYPKRWPQMRVLFNPLDCNALLGTSLKEAEMKKMLLSLGCVIKKKEKKQFVIRNSQLSNWLIEIPAERLDLTTPEDLYEEIGRVCGWEQIQAAPPHAPLAAGKEEPIYRLAELARTVLTGMGYSEHIGYSFVAERIGKLLKKSGVHFPEVENPLNTDTKYLRPMLLPSLLDAVAKNEKRRDSIRLFEIGKTFFNAKEQWSLAFAVYLKKGNKKHDAWYEIKGVVDGFLGACGLDKAVFREGGDYLLYEPSTYAAILADDTSVGCVAVIARNAKELYGIEGTIAHGFMDLDALLTLEQREREFAEIPKFPSSTRDIAVLVQKGTKVETVQNVIEREGGELLFDVDLFDTYEGEGVGDDQESLAFHLIFQSAERTLRDAEVNILMEKIVQGLKAEGWEIRE